MAVVPPSRPGGKSSIVGGFQEEAPSGVEAASVGQAVRAESGKIVPERVYNGLARNFKITNRAKIGPRAGKPFMTCVGGETYPEGANGDDPSTWLQPGEGMFVDRSTAMYICGNVFDRLLPDKQDIIRRYGDWEFEGIPEQGVVGRIPPLKIIGPPRYMPDLVVEQVDQRGKRMGEPIAMFELYTKGQVFRKQRAGYEREADMDAHLFDEEAVPA
jgi:hypothetical protein